MPETLRTVALHLNLGRFEFMSPHCISIENIHFLSSWWFYKTAWQCFEAFELILQLPLKGDVIINWNRIGMGTKGFTT